MTDNKNKINIISVAEKQSKAEMHTGVFYVTKVFFYIYFY